jgi:predicted amidophosphoribosyltransferase
MSTTRVIAAAADLLFGARCAGCGAVAIGACPDCCATLAAERPLLRGIDDGALSVVAAGSYQGVLKALLVACKERQGLGLVGLLSRRLTVSIAVLAAARPSRRYVLVPVPSARAQVARRGQDVTLALARAAAVRLRRAGLSVTVAACLRHRRRVADQAGLGVSARRRNLSGAFTLRRAVPPGEVIVIDDIVTTGASLTEAVRVLTAAGRPPLGAATVAATPLRRRG